LLEVGRAFDGAGLDPKALGFGVVMQRLVTAIGLFLQHLCGSAKRACQYIAHVIFLSADIVIFLATRHPRHR